MSKRLAIVTAAVVAILSIGGTIVALASPSAADSDNVKVSVSAMASEFKIAYTATISNSGTTTVGDLFAAISIPTGATFAEVSETPTGASALGKQGDNVAWLISQLAPGATVKVSYKVSVSGRTAGPVHAWVKWNRPSAGAVMSADTAFAETEVDLPKRGCKSCHVQRDANTGAVTIAYEAMTRGGPNHPKLAFDTEVTTCLGCHKPGTGDREGMGVVAPKMLRAIVHPVHMNSPAFTEHYKGNCFSCHEVNGEGRFTLLYDSLDRDFRGIPSKVPVKGIPPSEGK